MTHLGLFEGIGGFSLAAKWMGWDTLAWCEINEFCKKVLKYHFPKAEGFGDIKESNFTKYANKIDVLTGGFPCQPNSRAGKQKFQEDERHLWKEMFRVYKEVKPHYGVGENVPGIIDSEFSIKEIKCDLESIGYSVLPIKIPANIIGARHRRERIWFISYPSGIRLEGGKQGLFSSSKTRSYAQDLFTRGIYRSEWRDGLPRPGIFRNDDGLSKRLSDITISKWRSESIKAYGNAIVPQLAFEIFKSINDLENRQKFGI